MRSRPPADGASGRTGSRPPGPRDSALGLDELMIVNPTADGVGGLFLGEDGTLYQVLGASAEASRAPGPLFLGEDGTLYRAEGVAEPGPSGAEPPPPQPPAPGTPQLGGYLLAADGTLYEVTG